MADARTFEHCETPLAIAPGSSPFHIKGEFYRQLSGTVTHYDQKTGGAVMREMETEPGLAAFVGQQFMSSSMYDCLPMPRMMMAMARALGRDVRELTETIGRVGAEQQRKGVYKSIFSVLTPKNFSTRFGSMMEYLYDFGRTSIENHPDGLGATLVRLDIPAAVAEWWSCASVPFVKVPLMANGCKSFEAKTRVELSKLGGGSVPLAHARWDVRWTV